MNKNTVKIIGKNLTDSFNLEISKLNDQIFSLQTSHKNQIQLIDTEHESEISKTKTTFKSEIKSLNITITSLEHAHSNLENDYN